MINRVLVNSILVIIILISVSISFYQYYKGEHIIVSNRNYAASILQISYSGQSTVLNDLFFSSLNNDEVFVPIINQNLFNGLVSVDPKATPSPGTNNLLTGTPSISSKSYVLKHYEDQTGKLIEAFNSNIQEFKKIYLDLILSEEQRQEVYNWHKKRVDDRKKYNEELLLRKQKIKEKEIEYKYKKNMEIKEALMRKKDEFFSVDKKIKRNLFISKILNLDPNYLEHCNFSLKMIYDNQYDLKEVQFDCLENTLSEEVQFSFFLEDVSGATPEIEFNLAREYENLDSIDVLNQVFDADVMSYEDFSFEKTKIKLVPNVFLFDHKDKSYNQYYMLIVFISFISIVILFIVNTRKII